MNHIEPLEQRLQFASDVIDQTFGFVAMASVDMTTPLGPKWRLTSRSFALDSGGRVYGMADLEERSDEGATVDHKIVITRLSRDGQFDPTFGESGYKILERPLEDGHPTGELSIGVDPNNRAYIADGPLLWRLTPGGRADMTFGRRGKIFIPVLNTGIYPYASPVVFDSNGRAYLGGTSQGKTGMRMTVIRLTEEGGIDFTWWNGAYKSPVHPSSRPGSRSVVKLLEFRPDGKLLIVGEFSASYLYDEFPLPDGTHFAVGGAWVARLNADSTVDTTYGVGGYAEESYKSIDVEWGTPRPLDIEDDGSVLGWTQLETDERGPEALSRFDWTLSADGKSVAEKPPRQGSGPPFVPVDATAHDGSRIALTTTHDDNLVEFTRYFRDDAPLAVYDGRQIRAPRTTALRFVVTYRDDEAVKADSLDSRDIQVFGPFDGGEPRNKYAALESMQTLSDGRLMAIYHIASPGGWTRADNGLYTVNLRGGQVEDINGVAAPASTLGTFRVRIS